MIEYSDIFKKSLVPGDIITSRKKDVPQPYIGNMYLVVANDISKPDNPRVTWVVTYGDGRFEQLTIAYPPGDFVAGLDWILVRGEETQTRGRGSSVNNAGNETGRAGVEGDKNV